MTKFGFFVELEGVFVEGLVHVSTLAGDYFHFEAGDQCLVGERTGAAFGLGDIVTVQVAGVDVDERKIDLELLTHSPLTSRRRTKKKPVKKTTKSVKKTTKKVPKKKTTKKPSAKKKVAKKPATKKKPAASKAPVKKATVAKKDAAVKAAPKKRRPRKKKTYTRKTAIWNIYSPTMKIVAQFAFHEEKEAKEKLAKLNKKGKANHCMIRAKIEEEIPIEEMPVK